MEAEDVAGSGATARSACCAQIALRTRGDRFYPRDQPFRRRSAPVAGDQRPHDDALVQFARDGNDPRVSRSEGWPQPPRRSARGRDDGIIAAAKLNGDLIRLKPKKIGMGVRVIADDVAARGRLFQQVRAFARVFSDNKKSRASFVTVKKIEQLRSDCGIGPVVKRESKLAPGIRP